MTDPVPSKKLDALIRRVNALIPSSVTPDTRIQIHPCDWLTLVDALQPALEPSKDLLAIARKHNQGGAGFMFKFDDRALLEMLQEVLSTAPEPADDLLEASQRVSAIALGAAGKHAEKVVELEAEVSTLREHLAEVNRLLSLNVAEVERLRASQPPTAVLALIAHIQKTGFVYSYEPVFERAQDALTPRADE